MAPRTINAQGFVSVNGLKRGFGNRSFVVFMHMQRVPAGNTPEGEREREREIETETKQTTPLSQDRKPKAIQNPLGCNITHSFLFINLLLALFLLPSRANLIKQELEQRRYFLNSKPYTKTLVKLSGNLLREMRKSAKALFAFALVSGFRV